MQSDSKIYIAGHKGLVGSAITRKLQEKGHRNLILREKADLDLTIQEDVYSFFMNESPEYVVLAAAIVGGIYANNTYRADFIYNNLTIQNNVIYAAWKSGVKKLLFLGSTCIYPKDAPQPLKEDYLLTSALEHTNEPYAIAKIAGLKMCESFNLQYGTNFITVMPTNIYGEGDNYDLEKSHVLPALLRKFHLGRCLEENNWEAIREDLKRNPVGTVSGNEDEKTILTVLKKHGINLNDSAGMSVAKRNVMVTVWGSGSPFREFMNSKDMAEACIYLLENVDTKNIIEFHASANSLKDYHPPHFINIGTGQELTIRDLAHKIKDITQFKGEIVFNTSVPDGPKRKVTDISALLSLGYSPKIDLDTGLRETYELYKERRS